VQIRYRAVLMGDVEIWESDEGEWHRQDKSSTATAEYGVSPQDALREILDGLASGRLLRLIATRHGFSCDSTTEGSIGVRLILENRT
jgi:hypothetical protein